MTGPPEVFGAAHHGVQNLVVILAAAKISRNAVRELLSRGVGICFQESYGSHQEAGHAESTLEALLVNDALLHGMQRAVSAGKTFDGDDFACADRVREHRAGILRNIVNQDRARAAFSAVAAEFRAGETQLVTQRPRERFLLQHVYATLLAV